jgi:hypothetical protein
VRLARPVSSFAAILGASLPLLGLAAPTAWLLLPVHAAFACAVVLGAGLDGLMGRPEQARRWGFAYLLVCLAIAVGLEVGARARGASVWGWGVPWLVLATWAWAPPVIAALAGWLGEGIRVRKVRRTVRHRRAARAAAAGASTQGNPPEDLSAQAAGREVGASPP